MRFISRKKSLFIFLFCCFFLINMPGAQTAKFRAIVTAYYNEDSPLEGGAYLSINPHKGNLKVQNGVVAVDPKYWPYGTVFYIKNAGVVVAADTGSSIKGQERFDLAIIKNSYFESKKACLKWGRQKTTVYVLYQPEKAKEVKKTAAVAELRKSGVLNYLHKRKILLTNKMKKMGIAEDFYIAGYKNNILLAENF